VPWRYVDDVGIFLVMRYQTQNAPRAKWGLIK